MLCLFAVKASIDPVGVVAGWRFGLSTMQQAQAAFSDIPRATGLIDFRDIVDTEIINLINEKAVMQDNDYIKEAYKYDFLI
jgi:hypothetical protein